MTAALQLCCRYAAFLPCIIAAQQQYNDNDTVVESYSRLLNESCNPTNLSWYIRDLLFVVLILHIDARIAKG